MHYGQKCPIRLSSLSSLQLGVDHAHPACKLVPVEAASVLRRRHFVPASVHAGDAAVPAHQPGVRDTLIIGLIARNAQIVRRSWIIAERELPPQGERERCNVEERETHQILRRTASSSRLRRHSSPIIAPSSLSSEPSDGHAVAAASTHCEKSRSYRLRALAATTADVLVSVFCWAGEGTRRGRGGRAGELLPERGPAEGNVASEVLGNLTDEAGSRIDESGRPSWASGAGVESLDSSSGSGPDGEAFLAQAGRGGKAGAAGVPVPDGATGFEVGEEAETELGGDGGCESIGEVTIAAGGLAGKAGLLRVVGEMCPERLFGSESVLSAACVLDCSPRDAASGEQAKVAFGGSLPLVVRSRSPCPASASARVSLLRGAVGVSLALLVTQTGLGGFGGGG